MKTTWIERVEELRKQYFFESNDIQIETHNIHILTLKFYP